ncbi:hypothetical protein [Peptacetobacter sp.]|uniref:hypothetical protein n=1 Tax=Peptacetobacter sp. TaxID=2991975 RepID=UPI00261D4DA8|nr:hypothetical protein [Peptacetobacter sp.]
MKRKMNMIKFSKRKRGSVSLAAIIVLTFLTISCSALQVRLDDYIKSEHIDIESENLLRKAEGVTLIAKEKVIEATQNLYDESISKNDLKNKIESFSYRKKYISTIENLSDVNIDNSKIDVYQDDIKEDGSLLYKFWINITVKDTKKDMIRKMSLCVTLKNIYIDKVKKEDKEKIEENKEDINKKDEIKDVNKNNPNENIESDENNNLKENKDIIDEDDVPIKYNAKDALIFRVEKEY